MTKREAVIKTIRHEAVAPVPYSLEMTEQTHRIMKDYTGDTDFHANLPEPDFCSYRFTEPDEAAIREKCKHPVRQDDKFKIYNIGFSMFERAWTLRGMENVLCDFIG